MSVITDFMLPCLGRLVEFVAHRQTSVWGVKSKDAHEQDSVTSKLRRGEDDNGSLSCAFRHCQVLLRMRLNLHALNAGDRPPAVA